MDSEQRHVPTVPITYVFIKRPGHFTFEQPTNPDGFHRLIEPRDSADDTSNTQELCVRSWMRDSDELVQTVDGGEMKITEKLLAIQRRLHNQFDVSYKDVLDIEIVMSEEFEASEEQGDSDQDNQIIEEKADNSSSQVQIHRYPAEGRLFLDFQSKILHIMVEMGLTRQRVLREGNKRLLVFVLMSSSENRRALSDLVERYLEIENREYERKQIMEEVGNSRLFSPFGFLGGLGLGGLGNSAETIGMSNPFRPGVRVSQSASGNPSVSMPMFRPSANSERIQPSASQFVSSSVGAIPTNSLANIFGSSGPHQPGPAAPSQINSQGSQGSSGSSGSTSDFMRRIARDDNRRSDALNSIRRSLGRNDAMMRPFPNVPSFPDFGDGLPDEFEVTYAMMPGSNRPQMVEASFIGDNIVPAGRGNRIFGNLLNLLRFVNHLPENMIPDSDLAALMEPVRVTVGEEGMRDFLIYFDYKIDDGKVVEPEELKVKDQKSCVICHCDYEDGDKVAYLKTCHHLFHEECIRKWLTEYNHKCPVCRLSADPQKNESTNSQTEKSASSST